jgi:hypothetical protein
MRKIFSSLAIGILILSISACGLLQDIGRDSVKPVDVAGVWVGKTGPVVVNNIPYLISLLTGDPFVTEFIPLKLNLVQPKPCPVQDENEDTAPACFISGEITARAAGEHKFQIGGEIEGRQVTLAGTHKPFPKSQTYTIVMLATLSGDRGSMGGTWTALNEAEEIVKTGAWSVNKQ